MENVPVHSNRPIAVGQDVSRPVPTSGRPNRQRGNRLKLVTAVLGVVVVVAIVAFGVWALQQASPGAQIEGNKYQAVFLTNGQVYFGKLHTAGASGYTLTDVFYIQAKQDASSTNPQNASPAQSTNLQLIKLGNEVHGPEDKMIIDKAQVLFFENLKKDGKVASTISQYQTKK